MAALVKHQSLFWGMKITFNCGNIAKYSAKPPKQRPPQRKPGPSIYTETLEAKGYLRPRKAYTPPENVDQKLDSIFLSVVGKKCDSRTPLSDPELRFTLLNTCFRTFNHDVPNSLLYTVRNIGDVIAFYKTPVDAATPMERYQYMDLPPNLHIQHEYKRFDPESDTLFDGVSAFPKSGTLVTSLKHRKKYKSTKPQVWKEEDEPLGYIDDSYNRNHRTGFEC